MYEHAFTNHFQYTEMYSLDFIILYIIVNLLDLKKDSMLNNGCLIWPNVNCKET